MKTVQAAQIEITVLFTAFVGAVYGFGMYLLPAIAESVRRDIHFSYGTMGLIAGGVQAGFLAASAVAGFLTLRFGATNLILFSIVLSALALGGLALAGSVPVLGALLLILGACASFIWVPMVEVSREIIPPRNRAKALGLMSSGTGHGVFINSMLLATVLPEHGWRALWAATCAVVAALALYSLWRLAPMRYRRQGRKGEEPVSGSGKSVNRVRIAGLPRRLVGGILAMMFLNGMSCMSFQTYLSAYLVGQLGFGEAGAASAWGIIGLVGMFSGFLMGVLADRITIRRGMAVTCLVLGLSSLMIMLAGTGAGRHLLVHLAAVAFGLSFYAIFGLVPAYISHLFDDGNAAVVFAFGNVTLGVGGMAGNLAGGYAREITGSFDLLYLMILAAAILSAVIAMRLPGETESRPGDHAPPSPARFRGPG